MVYRDYSSTIIDRGSRCRSVVDFTLRLLNPWEKDRGFVGGRTGMEADE
jgi:hypothetical protein